MTLPAAYPSHDHHFTKPGANAMQFVKLDLSNAIASIRLQHAGGNRINFQMREEIFSAVESVAKSDARVLVIKGDGWRRPRLA